MAFLASTSVQWRRNPRRRQNVCKRTTVRSELSVGTVVFDLVALGSVVAGARYYYQNSARGGLKSTDDQPEFATKGEEAEEETGIIGLMGDSRSNPMPASFPRPAGRPLSEVANPPAEVLPNRSERMSEELTLALGNISDLGDVSVIIFDGGKRVLRAQGDLIVDGAIGTVVERGVVARRDNAVDFPFLDKERTKAVASYPLGDTGAIMVVASDEKGFFGDMEERVAKAVTARLAAFMPVELPKIT